MGNGQAAELETPSDLEVERVESGGATTDYHVIGSRGTKAVLIVENDPESED